MHSKPSTPAAGKAEPMAARRGYADWEGRQVHFRHAGAGAPVVVLGGAPRSGSQFDPLIEQLAPLGFHVIAPDMPGFGQSDPVAPGTGMEALSGFLNAVLDVLGLPAAHLFGLHSGAKVTTAFAASIPARALSLFVAGKTHSIVADFEARNEAVLAVVHERYFANGADQVQGPEAIRGWAAQQRNFTKAWWDDSLFTHADTDEALRALEAKLIDDLAGRHTVREFYAANCTYDFAQGLAQVKCPLMVLEITSDAEDRTLGRQARALVAGVSGARTSELPQIDGPGLFLHTGIGAMAGAIADFIAAT
jgi:pimeloyl-ACP methyl ester carboxylesterase